ncbi:MAG: CYTH domain-containing protein [Crocosphaera sp.]
MGIEIERKFLVINDNWRSLAQGKVYRQGYISTNNKMTTVRVRIIGEQAYLTIKSQTEGISRQEFEYPIPFEDGKIMLDNLCDRPLIEKTRYQINHDSLIWEIDEFQGENQGLIIAEVELENESQIINLPDWVGKEVSDDPKYYNVNLTKSPYQTW